MRVEPPSEPLHVVALLLAEGVDVNVAETAFVLRLPAATAMAAAASAASMATPSQADRLIVSSPFLEWLEQTTLPARQTPAVLESDVIPHLLSLGFSGE